VSNHTAGHNAEKRAAQYLAKQGFAIRVLNWKTKYCEIDIIAEKSRSIYFVEVKYRRTVNQGQGMDYITPSKLKRMQFAAEVWVQQHNWDEQYQLAVISVDADDITFIDEI
jgi:Holliday junction resolvase-like predicted endonuclease